jgi:ribosomal protein RSM22 (predicted rRNA methylase)
LERFTITKAQGKQVYYDARKIKWGDLWAFGSRKPGIKREVIFKQNMRGRGRIGLRRKGDVEEQIEMRDEDLMCEDEETSAWVQRKLGRLQKVQKKQERREAKRALRAAGGELR